MIITKNGAYVLLILAVCLWATSATISTLAMDEGVSVIELTTIGFIFASIVFFPLVAMFDRKSLRIDRRDIPTFVVFSFIAGAMLNLAFFGAISETTVAIAVILNFTYPSIVSVVSLFIFKERLSTQKLLALPLTFFGCVLVAGSPLIEGNISVGWFAVGLGLLSAVGSATYYIGGKKLEEKYSANTVVLYLFMLTTIMLVIAANPVSLLHVSFTTNAWLLIFMLAVLPGILGFLASLVALRHIEASKASIISSIEPMLAIGMAFVVLSEGVTAIQLAGAAVTVIGIILLRLGKS
ncbi:MAG: DMT family transporter [Methanobacteriota archaeon]|nr:MAG: DMT family transporter [Euryarchaeota archaeon]